MAWDFGTVHHIHLNNLDVHDVNGSLVKKDRGENHGIVWENGGGKIKSRFDGLRIENCRLVRTDRNASVASRRILRNWASGSLA